MAKFKRLTKGKPKAKKQKTANPCGLLAYDIETNQYYSYETWAVSHTKPVDVPKGIWAVIEEAVGKRKHALKAVNYSAGHNYAEDVYNEVYNQLVKRIEIDGSIPFETAESMRDLIKVCLNDVFTVGDYKVVAQHSEMYMGTVVALPTMINGRPFYTLSLEEYTNEVRNAPSRVALSLDETEQMFRDIENKAKENKAPVVVLIHNLSYEVVNCLSNLPIWREWVQSGRLSFLSNNTKDSYKSIDIAETAPTEENKRPDPVILFRDTWKLTNMSIAKVGKIHKYPKLDYTYNVIRDSSKLTQKDYEYNRRDCEISLLAFYDSYKQAGDILWNDRKAPISANNIVSTIAKDRFSKEFVCHKKRVQADGEAHLTDEEYADYKPTTGGGLVGVVPEFAFNTFEENCTYKNGVHKFTVESIKHIDLNSAHPSQSFKRLFPVSKPKPLTDPEGIAIVKEALKRGIKNANAMCTYEGIRYGLDRFDTLLPDLKKNTSKKGGYFMSGYATFAIKNIRLKQFNASGSHFTVPCMWGCKISTKLSGVNTYVNDECIKVKGENVEYIGSKLKLADKIVCKLTFEDFITIIGLFYDFDDFEILDCKLYSMNFISPYLYKQFEYFANKKIAYKKAVKAIKADNKEALTEALECPYYERQDSIAVLAEYEAKGIGAEDFAEQLLLTTKGQFNGIYGTSYQSLFRDSSILEYDDSTQSVVWGKAEGTDGTKYDDKNSSGIDILQGSYIAQWSRVDLALHIRMLINLGAVPLYFATDSVYYLSTDKTDSRLDDVLNGKVSQGEKPFNRQTPKMKKYRPTETGLGGMDFESDIKSIGYTQALKIISVEKNINYDTGEVKEIRKVTFSGCSADTFFKNCKTDSDYFARLFMPDGYVSAFEENAKTVKAGNNSGNNGFVLDSVGFVNNRSTAPQYQDIKRNSIPFIKV